jgi:hypothetical protein
MTTALPPLSPGALTEFDMFRDRLRHIGRSLRRQSAGNTPHHLQGVFDASSDWPKTSIGSSLRVWAISHGNDSSVVLFASNGVNSVNTKTELRDRSKTG